MLFDSGAEGYNKISNTYLTKRYNNKVFITAPWKKIYRTDAERDQSFEESIEVYERLYNWYKEHDYDLIVFPQDTIENRVGFILSQVTH